MLRRQLVTAAERRGLLLTSHGSEVSVSVPRLNWAIVCFVASPLAKEWS